MSVYFVTGKLGGGKTLVAVGKIRDYLRRGRPVVTNLDLQLDKLIGYVDKCNCLRIPDKPSVDDLLLIGRGNDTADESNNGLIVLDELGTWFNSRNFQDKSRQPLIDWFLHSRKLGWDLMLIVQDIDLIDKQARISLNEHIVVCKRTDRLPIPLISNIMSMFTRKKIPIPKVHVGVVFYGEGHSAVKTDTWIYRGRDLYAAYDTRQVFSSNYSNGVYSYLPTRFFMVRPGRLSKGYHMRLTKIVLRKYSHPLLFACGFFFSFVLMVSVFALTVAFNNESVAVSVPVSTPVSTESISSVDNVSQYDRTKDVDKKVSLDKKVSVESILYSDSDESSSDLVELLPLKKLSYLVHDRNGKSEYKILYKGVHSPRTFPFELSWIDGEPYARVE